MRRRRAVEMKEINEIFKDLGWVDSFTIRSLDESGGVMDFYTTIPVEGDFKKLQALDERVSRVGILIRQPVKRGSVIVSQNAFKRFFYRITCWSKGGYIYARGSRGTSHR